MNPLLSKYLFYYPTTFFKGEFIRKYLKEYSKNQFLDHNTVEEKQLFYVKKLLSYASSHCPFYKELYRSLGVDLNINSLAEFSRIPPITKQDIIEHHSLISSGMSNLRVTSKTTGGSSGHPVTILKNVTALARERAATWRSYAWAGVHIGDPQARFWGIPLSQTNRLKYRVIDLIANRIRLSAFDMSRLAMGRYYTKIHKFRPVYLYGYVSMIDAFGQYINEEGLDLPDSMVAIITTSEILSENVKNRIQNNLSRRVFNEYGCGEVGSIAHECSSGSMHIMADNLIVEIEESGEIIVTDLHNYAMPLIRYRLNDFSEFSTKKCSCGCNFPILEKIYGRAYDLVRLSNGETMHPEIIMYVFEEFKDRFNGLRQFQFVQHDVDLASINLVVNNEFNKLVSENHFINRLSQVLDTRLFLTFNYVDEIKRENSGKIRLVKCEVR